MSSLVPPARRCHSRRRSTAGAMRGVMVVLGSALTRRGAAIGAAKRDSAAVVIARTARWTALPKAH